MIALTRWKSFGHKGDMTENLIEHVNSIYERKGMALITKMPVPVKVTKIGSGRIVEAYFEKRSTVDYYGICQGHSICFDVKETDRPHLPLQNIHDHQIEYMLKFKAQGGFSFVICNFKKDGRYFLIPIELIESYWRNASEGGRKSIPIDAIDARYEIPSQSGLPDYIVTLGTYINSAADVSGEDC